MKKLILIFILIASSQSFAQITLTSANNPVAGDVSYNTSCDTTNISEGNSGATSWSYLNLTAIDTSSFRYVAASSTPYDTLFPTSNVAAVFDTSFFSYYTTSPSIFLTNGSASDFLITIFSDPQTGMQYPFAFTNSFTDNFAATSSSVGFQSFRTGSVTATADAWGTINLPIGSFSNALRVKYVINSRDSSSFGSITTTTSTSYSWFVSGRKFPIFDIGYFSLSINGIPLSSSKSVNYGTNVPIGISNISTEVPDNYMLSQNYPNPFNPTTKLRFAIPKTGLVNVTVFDAIGREVETLVNTQLQTGTYEVDWNAANFSGGTYFYRLQVGGFVETKKMILVK